MTNVAQAPQPSRIESEEGFDWGADELLEAAARLSPAWLAGFFDGDGCISCTESRVYSNRKGQQQRPSTIIVFVCQRDPEILALLSMKFRGGRLYKAKASLKSVLWRLEWTGRTALQVLDFVKDFVILKRRRVVLGVEFCKLVLPHGNHTDVGISISARRRRDEIALEIQSLNRRNMSVARKEYLDKPTAPKAAFEGLAEDRADCSFALRWSQRRTDHADAGY